MQEWKKYPGHSEYEMEFIDGICTDWMRCVNMWDVNGWWSEHNAETGEKRWRKVSIGTSNKPIKVDWQGYPVTEKIVHEDPYKKNEESEECEFPECPYCGVSGRVGNNSFKLGSNDPNIDDYYCYKCYTTF